MYKLYKIISLLFRPMHILFRELIFILVKLRYSFPEPNEILLDKKKPVLYILSAPGYLNSLVLEKIAMKYNLPPTGYIQVGKDFHAKNVIWLSPYKNEHTKFNKDTIYKYCESVKKDITTANKLQFLPINVFWGRKQNEEKSFTKLLTLNNRSMLGPFRRLFAIAVHGRQLYIQWGKPVTLKDVVSDEVLQNKDANYLAKKAERLLNLYFLRVATQVLGPNLSHRQTLLEGILTTPNVKKAIREEAQNNNINIEKVRAKSKKIAEEIVSNQSHGGIRFMYIVLNWLWNKLYNGTNIANIDNIKTLAGKYSIVYLPAHRSHIDYLLLSYVLYVNGMMPPHVAAGINLNLPIIGNILRHGGAFFMRRSFKKDKLYKAIFEEYIYTLFDRGHPVEYFVEGGRSRTGRTLKAKPGLLAMTVKACLRGTTKPILLVPVYFGYERVLEGNTYLSELKGKQKEKETFFSIFKVLPTLKQNFGEVTVNFGEPMVLDKFISKDANLLKKVKDGDQSAFFSLIDNLTKEVTIRINRATTINSVNLFATVLLSSQHLVLEEKVLCAQLELFKKLQLQAPYSNQSYIKSNLSCEKIVAHITEMNLIQKIEHSRGDLIKVDENTGIMLTWYRNNISHIYMSAALIAFMFINKKQISKSTLIKEFKLLMPILEAEFFISYDEKDYEKVAEKLLEFMVDNDLLIYNYTRKIYKTPALDSLEAIQLQLLAQLIRPTLERGYLILYLLSKYNSKIDKQTLLEECVELLKRLTILQGLNAPDYFDKNIFQNSLDIFIQSQYILQDKNDKLSYNAELGKSFKSINSWFNTQFRQNIMQLTWDNTEKK